MSDSILLLEYEYDQLMIRLDEYLELSDHPGGNTTAFENYRLDCLTGNQHDHDCWRVGIEKAGEGIFSSIINFFASILKAIGSAFLFITGIRSTQKRYQEVFAKFEETIKNGGYQKSVVNMSGLPTIDQLKAWNPAISDVNIYFSNMLKGCDSVRIDFEKEVKNELTNFKNSSTPPKIDADAAKEKYHTIQHQTFSPAVPHLAGLGMSISSTARLSFSPADFKLFSEGTKLDLTNASEREPYIKAFAGIGTQFSKESHFEENCEQRLKHLNEQMNSTRDALVAFANNTKSKETNRDSKALTKPSIQAYRKQVLKGLRVYLYICSNFFMWIRTYLKATNYVFKILNVTMERFNHPTHA